MKKFYEKHRFKERILLIILLAQLLSYNNLSAQKTDSLYLPPNGDEMITALNFKDTDIRDVVRTIAFEYKTNIWIDNNIKKNISIALFDIRVSQALKIICEDNNLLYKQTPTRFIIKTPEKVIPLPPKENKPFVSYNPSVGNFSVDLENVKISAFVEELRRKTGKNFLLTNGTNGRLSGVLTNIIFETGLRNILQNNGFYLTESDSIYYISRSSHYSSITDSRIKTEKYWVSAKNNRITIDVKDAILDNILEDLIYQLDLQVIKLAEPENKVTVKCSNVPIEKALYYLFKETQYSYKNEDGIYIIGKSNTKSLDAIKLVKLRHLKAETVKEKIPAYFKQLLQIDVSVEHNALIVKGQNDAIVNLEGFIEQIDSPIPQVLIEALVVDYNLDKIYETGIRAGRGDTTSMKRNDAWFPGLDVTASGKSINKALNRIGTINLFGKRINVASLANLPDDFYVNIRMLETNGIANIKSRPILSTLNGHKATLKIGTTQNYVFRDIMPVTNQLSSTFIEQERIQQIEAMVSFEITPWVGPNNTLTLEIKPDFQTPVGEFSPDKNEIPAINKRSLESTIRLNDGETIVVGGLIQDIVSNSDTKFPILGDIPFIGELFTSKKRQTSKSELIIYLTPHIFYEEEAGFTYFNYSE